jgi:hypothetical protein
LITTNDVAQLRARLKGRAQPWTEEELQSVLPQALTNTSAWKATSSVSPEIAAMAIDGKMQTRYRTNKKQSPGMWFQIELPEPTRITSVQLDAGNDAREYPQAYSVQLSDDDINWGKPVAQGKGKSKLTDIHFAPATAKFVRVTQTGTADDAFWTIREFRVMKAPEKEMGIYHNMASKDTKSSKFE